MIKYYEQKIISIEDFEEFLTTKGFDAKLIRNAFAEYAENDSYNYWDLDVLFDAIDTAKYDECDDKLTVYTYVVEAIQNDELPNEFLLHVFW